MNNLQSLKWIDFANEVSVQDSNLIVNNDQGHPFILEWMKGNILCPELTLFKKELVEFSVTKLTLSELKFLKENPESASSEVFLMSSQAYLQNGTTTADWDAISDSIKTSITQFYLADLSIYKEALKPLLNDIYFFAKIKSNKGEPQGFLLFSVTPHLPFGDVKVVNFFVKSNLNLEKMLMNLVLKILPLTKRIFLFVRPTNESSLKMYASLDFKIDENPVQDPNHKINNNYICLEYRTENSTLFY